MVEATAHVTLPVNAAEAFAQLTDISRSSDWLPSIRHVRQLAGNGVAAGARYEVEATVVGRNVSGTVLCERADAPHDIVMRLEEGPDLTVTMHIDDIQGGCQLHLTIRYQLPGLLGGALDRASAAAARREAARTVERVAAHFRRRSASR